jgi:hypothetical protein
MDPRDRPREGFKREADWAEPARGGPPQQQARPLFAREDMAKEMARKREHPDAAQDSPADPDAAKRWRPLGGGWDASPAAPAGAAQGLPPPAAEPPRPSRLDLQLVEERKLTHRSMSDAIPPAGDPLPGQSPAAARTLGPDTSPRASEGGPSVTGMTAATPKAEILKLVMKVDASINAARQKVRGIACIFPVCKLLHQ